MTKAAMARRLLSKLRRTKSHHSMSNMGAPIPNSPSSVKGHKPKRVRKKRVNTFVTANRLRAARRHDERRKKSPRPPHIERSFAQDGDSWVAYARGPDGNFEVDTSDDAMFIKNILEG